MMDAKRLTAVAEWTGLVLPVACAPLLLFPKIRWMWVLVVLPLPLVLHSIIRKQPRVRTSLNAFLVFLLLMVGVSAYATPDLELSIGKMAGVLLGVFLFWGISNFTNTETRLKWMLWTFLAGGLGLIALALIGTAWWNKFPALGGFTNLFPLRLSGLPGAENGFNPNAVGGALILFVPLVAALATYYVRRKEGPFWRQIPALGASLPLLLLLVGTLLLCQSRGAWFGLGGGVAVGVMLRFRPARFVGLSVGIMAVVLALIYQPWVGWGARGRVFMNAEISILQRLALWSEAVDGIRDFPLTGMGMNVFRTVVNAPHHLLEGTNDKDMAHCHNQLLQTALDLGIPGFVAYVALWTAVLGLLWHVWRRTQSPFHRAVALGLGCGLVAQFVFGLSDAIALGAKVGVFWWIALALAVSLDRLQRPVPDYPIGSYEPARPWGTLLFWALISLLSVSLMKSYGYVALSIALIGGVSLGLLSVRGPRPAVQHDVRSLG